MHRKQKISDFTKAYEKKGKSPLSRRFAPLYYIIKKWTFQSRQKTKRKINLSRTPLKKTEPQHKKHEKIKAFASKHLEKGAFPPLKDKEKLKPRSKSADLHKKTEAKKQAARKCPWFAPRFPSESPLPSSQIRRAATTAEAWAWTPANIKNMTFQ